MANNYVSGLLKDPRARKYIDAIPKYYIPSIEEFHVGFECEVEVGYVGSFATKIIQENDNFQTIRAYGSRIRVKHLDRKDIESFGFVWDNPCYEKEDIHHNNFDIEGGENAYHVIQRDYYRFPFTKEDSKLQENWNKKNYVLEHFYKTNTYTLVSFENYSDAKIVFKNFTIKNKSEFKRLLIQGGFYQTK